MTIIYEGRELDFLGIEQKSRTYYTFKYDNEIIWLFRRNDKWYLSWGGSSKKDRKAYQWFGDGGEDKRQKEGERFAEFLFEHSKLRLLLIFD